MGKIRRLSLLDKKQLCDIASNMDNGNILHYPFIKNTTSFIQEILPLKFHLMPNSFVYLIGNKIQGMISLSTTRGNRENIDITHLIFNQNDYITAKKLVKFAVKHLGEVGARTFKVVIDNNCKDLETLFLNGCSFRCGSYENLWEISHDIDFFSNYQALPFKVLDDGHAQSVSELYNAEINPYYRPALERMPEEFKEPLLKFNDNNRENQYVLFEDRKRKKVIAYLTIQTGDNFNFVITPVKINGYELDYNALVAFAIQTIKKHRSSKFQVYLKQKKCLKFAQDFEEYLHARKYFCIQTQHVLIKEFYQPVKQGSQSFILGENKIFSS